MFQAKNENKHNWTWMAMLGAVLALTPACVDGDSTSDDDTPDFEATGDIALDGEPRVLVGDEARSFQEANTSGSNLAAGLVTVCSRKVFAAPAGGNMTWDSCIRNDHLMWMAIIGDLEISRSYAQLSVAGIDTTTGFRSFPAIVAAPFNRAALVILDAHGMWRAGDWFVASTAVRAANQPWSWPLLSPQQRW